LDERDLFKEGAIVLEALSETTNGDADALREAEASAREGKPLLSFVMGTMVRVIRFQSLFKVIGITG
jgi:hypothetical protein